MYSYTSDLWKGSTPIFVVEFELEGMLRRFCSGANNLIRVNSTDGEQAIPWGISHLEYTESVNLSESASVQENIVSIQLYTGVNLMDLWAKGISLEGVKASVYLLLENASGKITQQWDSKIRLYTGIIEEPVFGDPSAPNDLIEFSIEAVPWDAKRLMLGQNFIDSRFPDRDVDTADGRVFPLILGNPGKDVQQTDGSLLSFPAFPCYCSRNYQLVPIPGGVYNGKFLLAGHETVSQSMIITDGNSYTNPLDPSIDPPLTVTFENSSYPSYTYVGLLIVAPQGAFIPGETFNDPAQTWWGYFTDLGGGIANPYNLTEGLTKAGDVLRYALQLTGQKIDDGAFANISNFLNRYQIDGYINDPEIAVWDWVSGNLLPLLPIAIRSGPNGIKPILDTLGALTHIQPIASISLGINEEGTQLGPVETTKATSDIINDCTIAYAKNGLSQQHTQVSRCRAIATDNQDISSEYAILSESKYGTKPYSLQTDYVYDRATANLIAQDIVRRNSIITMQITVEIPIYYGYLQVGDIITVSSDFLNIKNHKMLVGSKEWSTGQTSWRFQLQFEQNTIQNIRS